MIWFSASRTLIILPNSVGLPGFPLRMISVVCSNRLTILPSDLVMPLMIRARVWLTTCFTRGSIVSISFFMPSDLDDFGGVFKQTDDLALRLGDAFDDPGARLAHHLFHAGKHRVDFFFHAFQGGLLQHVRGTLDSLHDLLREAFGLSHHLSGRAQQFAIALLQLLLYLRSTPAAGPSDLD